MRTRIFPDLLAKNRGNGRKGTRIPINDTPLLAAGWFILRGKMKKLILIIICLLTSNNLLAAVAIDFNLIPKPNTEYRDTGFGFGLFFTGDKNFGGYFNYFDIGNEGDYFHENLSEHNGDPVVDRYKTARGINFGGT